jgi:hypothetical protein
MKNELSGPLHSAAPSFSDPWSLKVKAGNKSLAFITQSSVLQHNLRRFRNL